MSRGKHVAPRPNGRKTRTFGRAVPLALTLLLVMGAMAWAAELDAEVESGANEVTVTQGETANFDIKLSATGAIKCVATAANPATAKVHTVFSLGASGGLTSGTLSPAFNFFAGAPLPSGNNCTVTWTGAPTPYSQAASVSAHVDTPPGDYTIVLSVEAGTTETQTPDGMGGGLDDNLATEITVHVLEAEDAITYVTNGFKSPVVTDDWNKARAGQSASLRWNLWENTKTVETEVIDPVLNGDSYSITSVKVACPSQDPVSDDPVPTDDAGTSGLRYDYDAVVDNASGQNVYVWKTNKAWDSTCRKLTIKYDGMDADPPLVAYFDFRK